MIDSHAHLGEEALFKERESLFSRALEKGITHILDIATNKETLENGLILKKEYPFVFLSASTTPHDAFFKEDPLFSWVEELAFKGFLHAIGETGLDYFKVESPKNLQKDYLIRYLDLAKRAELPIVIHCREAFSDFFQILDQEYKDSAERGVLHCFTGTKKEAYEVLDRGFYVSFSGILTFKKSVELQEIAKNIPLEFLLLETDAPYLSPEGHRGKINEPSFIEKTYAFLAELRNIPIENLKEQVSKNSHKLFSWDKM